jgi:acetyl esterase/lipase
VQRSSSACCRSASLQPRLGRNTRAWRCGRTARRARHRDGTRPRSQAADPVDRVNGRPDFTIFVYPGPLAVPATVPPTAPAAFLVAASDDPCCAVPTIRLLQQYRDAGVAVEAHIAARGGHGFNMGQRSQRGP